MATTTQSQTQQHTYALSDGDRIHLYGDSILQQCFAPNNSFSFGAALTDAYSRKLDVVNRSLSGNNTLQALRALSLCLAETPSQQRTRLLVIMFGANDARLSNTPGGPDQHIPLKDFTNNLRHMITHPSVQAHEGVKVVLVTTPPVDDRKCLKADQERYPHLGQTLRRTAATTATYAAAVRELGAELEVPVLDIHTTMLALSGHDRSSNPLPGSLEAPTNATLQSFLIDGLHFSGEGYCLLFTELMKLIELSSPELMSAILPMRLPHGIPTLRGRARWISRAGRSQSGGREVVMGKK
ncbi:hypothetical protein LTR17_011410 [Elasticomyces elasticus]|nr:hypothetical protein LTR17_011410 [Elasticomyces elasticus]